MEDMILSVNTLTEYVNRRFRSNRVRVHEENGVVTIEPFSETDDKTSEELEQIRQKRLAFKGCMNGEFWMSDDFDDPIEDMREYME